MQHNIKPYTAAWYHWAAKEMESNTQKAYSIAYIVVKEKEQNSLSMKILSCQIQSKIKNMIGLPPILLLYEIIFHRLFAYPSSIEDTFKRLKYNYYGNKK